MPDNLYTIADHVADEFGLSGAEITDLKQATPLLSILPAEESSNGTLHQYAKEVGAPVVGWRKVNAGRFHSKSSDVKVTESLEILDFSWKVDKADADIWKKGGKSAFVAREGFRHIVAAYVAFENQIISGTGFDAAGINGFADADTINAKSDEMVVDAGGSTANTASSVYFVQMGSRDVMSVYNGDGVISLGDTVISETLDTNGKSFPAYYTPGCTWLGLQIGSKFSLGRIANLTAQVGKGLTDALAYEMLERMPVGRRKGLVAVCGSRSVRQLQSSRTATNATGTVAPWPTEIAGIPVVETDSIGKVEAILA